jgi:hypothetical protein
MKRFAPLAIVLTLLLPPRLGATLGDRHRACISHQQGHAQVTLAARTPELRRQEGRRATRLADRSAIAAGPGVQKASIGA